MEPDESVSEWEGGGSSLWSEKGLSRDGAKGCLKKSEKEEGNKK